MRHIFLLLILTHYGLSAQINQHKINGITIVAPDHPVDSTYLIPVKKTSTNWIAFNPYAFCTPDDPIIYFDSRWQWWGERSEGIRTMVISAKKKGYKIMIKPHLWVKGQGWGGELDYGNAAQWRAWETHYTRYMLHFARLAQQTGAEMLCIGTEMKTSVLKRPEFWKHLIRNIRSVYDGLLCYAANWDNFQNIPFTDKLDYIGIDAYFPLQYNTEAAWTEWRRDIETFSHENHKKILFTEYGYQSKPETTTRPWETEGPHYHPNGDEVDMDAQMKAYKNLYNTFWDKSWFAGGFIWKWYTDTASGGPGDAGFTPQGKPVIQVIRKYYSAH